VVASRQRQELDVGRLELQAGSFTSMLEKAMNISVLSIGAVESNT
jgi:hypothetical protein